MKKIYYLFLFLNFVVYSQEIARIETTGNKKVELKKMSVNVEVVSDIAITTFDMQFYNSSRRVLEGEFFFPLGQGQSVTKFALDINGKLRDAVVVEKEKARVAFETTVRNKIDPALLEVTKGNNYKARIYPIPAKGYKRVVVTCKQKLLKLNNSYYYKIPPLFTGKLDVFSLKMNVLNKKAPIFKTKELSKFVLNSVNNQFTTTFSEKNLKNSEEIVIKIPLEEAEELVSSDNYFYFKKQLDIVPRKTKKLNRITIFWDNSSSEQYRKIARELTLLNSFFKQNPTINVNLVVFNADVDYQKTFKISNGNWSELQYELENMIYDGGSSFKVLKTHKDKSDKYLLFTDGLNTLSEEYLKLHKTVYVVNSSSIANHSYLENLAQLNKGKYINLSRITVKEAEKELNSEPLLFLGTNLENSETYPITGSVVNSNFSLSGFGRTIPKELKLHFGYGNQIVKTFTVKPDRKIKSDIVKNIWAEYKIKFLSKNKERSKNEIIQLSKDYQIISPFTSMIILDRVQDYVTHEIKPPLELQTEYNKLLAQKQNATKQQYTNVISRLQNGYKNYFDWYDKNIEIPKKEKTSSTNTTRHETINLENTSRSIRLTGSVLGVDSEPLIANILIKGTTIGTEADFDGNFQLNVAKNDIIVFSFIGYESLEKKVESNSPSPMNVRLSESEDNILEEVVVTGYSPSEKRRLTSSVAVVKASEIQDNERSVYQALQGKVAGLAVQSNANTASENKTYKLAKIYIVDGKETQNVNLKPSEIKEMYYLNEKQGQQLFGKKGSNGVVVYVTKKGYNDQLDAIDDFEDLVEQKVEFKGWNPKVPYLKEFNGLPDNKMYAKYLEIKKDYQNSPSFFIDIADVFYQRNQKEQALKILSNVVENDIDNYELLRALAYKYEEFGAYDKAIFVYREILKLRPEDIQSYRDLALALENNGEYQKALDLLHKIVNGELISKDFQRRFQGVENIALIEMNHLISLHKKELSINHINKDLIKKMSMDTRIVIDWNHNDTDIDLWVFDPNNEKCYYSHKNTKIGGKLSDDMTQGFGPEQFVLRKAIDGTYNIKAKYYSNSRQKISGPTFLKVSYFKNYGTKKEEKNTKLVRLKSGGDIIEIGKLIYK